MENLIRPYAQKGIPGFDLFLDYVHPTKSGNLVIASEAANKLISSGLLSGTPVSRHIDLNELQELNRSPYRDEDDPFVQFTRFSLCCMTHQYNSALQFGLLLRGSIPQGTPKNAVSGEIQLIDDAIKTLQHYLETEKRNIMGEASADEEEQAKKELRKFYQKYFPYGTF